MRSKLRRDIGLLKSYAAFSSLALLVVSAAAFRQATPSVAEFDEITVHRLNIVEGDGTTRLVLSNSERQAQVTEGGQQVGPDRDRPAGMIFFNEVGDEVGGLVFRGTETNDGHSAGGSLTFDRWKQDQTIALQYSERNGRYSSGLPIRDRPDQPLSEVAELLSLLAAATSESERTRLTQEILAFQPGHSLRVFVGRNSDDAATLVLSDADGRIPDFPVTRSHPPASWPSAANSSICRTYRKTAGEESRRRSPVANRWMRP